MPWLLRWLIWCGLTRESLSCLWGQYKCSACWEKWLYIATCVSSVRQCTSWLVVWGNHALWIQETKWTPSVFLIALSLTGTHEDHDIDDNEEEAAEEDNPESAVLARGSGQVSFDSGFFWMSLPLLESETSHPLEHPIILNISGDSWSNHQFSVTAFDWMILLRWTHIQISLDSDLSARSLGMGRWWDLLSTRISNNPEHTQVIYQINWMIFYRAQVIILLFLLINYFLFLLLCIIPSCLSMSSTAFNASPYFESIVRLYLLRNLAFPNLKNHEQVSTAVARIHIHQIFFPSWCLLP